MTTPSPQRGAIKRFREWLNNEYAETPQHRNGPYRQRNRPYGDYLYYQDRDKFNMELAEWLKREPAPESALSTPPEVKLSPKS